MTPRPAIAMGPTGWLGLAAVLAVAGYAWGRSRQPDSWRGKVVLITGGARGLGFALAETFASRGAIVWLVSRDAEELARAADRLRLTGAQVHVHTADITDAQAVGAMIDAVTARHLRLDAVVNNAGVITAMPFANAELADFQESMDTHFWGPLHVIRAALPWLQRSRVSHVINVSSIGGRVGVPHLAPYCAGKFALTGLSQALRAELAPLGVWVTLATPGLLRTGSVGRVKVRGNHVAEGRLFAALSATSLTSQNASAAARQIVDAAARRRAAVMPGWQAGVQHLANTLAPELMAAIMATATAHVLPAAADGPSPSRAISDLDLGWAEALVSTRTAVAYNQPEAALR